MEVKLESFQATMTDRLWWFVQNTCQPWNHDVMAFLYAEGLKLSKPGGICAVNAALRKP